MLSQRKRVILIKLETPYGVDSVPTTTDAVLCSALEITPIEGSSIERDFIRPYFGSSGQIRVENYASLSFETEIAGSSAAAVPPQWGALMKACNFSETITGTAITGTATSTVTAATIKLAAGASTVEGFYNGMTISITAGTGSGQSAEIINYAATTKICSLSTPFLIATDLTSAYSIGTNVAYTPNSEFGTATNETSVTIYFNVDGVRHILVGARGTFSIDLTVKQIPKIKWKFTGLIGTIADATLPAAVFTGWKTPVAISTENTRDINIMGWPGANVQKLSFDIGNTVIHRQLIGFEGVLITNRKPKGSISLEATTIAVKDWWTAATAGTYGLFGVKHGTVAGNIFTLSAQKMQLQDPKYSDSDGVAMIDMNLDFTPNVTAGNDEIKIVCK